MRSPNTTFLTATFSQWASRSIAFIAGFASLLWQTTALRIGIQEIGANRSTAAAILAMSLLGLAIGAAYFGKMADASSRRGRLASHLLFGISCATLMFAFCGRQFATLLANQIASASAANSGYASLIFSTIAIVPVHALIGGLIPVLLSLKSESAPVDTEVDTGKMVAGLYAIETLGAAVGGLVAVFLLVPNLGIFRTLVGCGIAGLAIASLSFWLFRRHQSETVSDASNSNLAVMNRPKWQSAMLLCAVFFTSFAALGMELIWQRYFVFVFGSDSRSYAVVVAAMLIGVSLGSALASIKVIRNRLDYGICLLLAGGAVAGSLLVLRYGMQVDSLQASLNFLLMSPFVSRFALAFAVILLPAVTVGLGVPLVSDLLIGSRKTPGTDLGNLYATMAIGNVTGVFISASWLVPLLGLHSAAVLLSALPILGAAIVFFCPIGDQRKSANRVILRSAHFRCLPRFILCRNVESNQSWTG